MNTLTHLRRSLRSTRAAIDLASIMVGVIVIGIVAGIIAAVVMVVIPWSQDQAARANLHAFQDAQAVAHVTQNGYLNTADLIDKQLLPAKAGSGPEEIRSALGPSCYVASTTSATGNVFYFTSRGPAVNPVLDTTDTSWYAPIPAEAWVVPDSALRKLILANVALEANGGSWLETMPADRPLTLADAQSLLFLAPVSIMEAPYGIDASQIRSLEGLQEASHIIRAIFMNSQITDLRELFRCLGGSDWLLTRRA